MARERDDYDDRDDDRDDDAPPPRRRRDRDDYDDYGPAKKLGPLDGMFAKTNVVILVLFALCCNGIALILGAVGYFTAVDPKAKSNAFLTMVLGGIITVVGIVAQVAMMGAGLAGAGGGAK